MEYPPVIIRRNAKGTPSYSFDGEKWWPSLGRMRLNYQFKKDQEERRLSIELTSFLTGGDGSTPADDQSREQRLRRAAKRQGLRLVKSRRRDPRAHDYGSYALVDVYTNMLVAGDQNTGYGLGLDEVEESLNSSTR
jgi:hypothetical protein